MDQPRHGHVAVLTAGIGHLVGRNEGFLQLGDNLPPDGAVRVVAFDEVEKVRRDGQRQLAARYLDARAFAGRQDEMLLKLFEPGNPVLELPFPVVPLLGGHVGPVAGGQGSEGGGVTTGRVERGRSGGGRRNGRRKLGQSSGIH